MLDSGGPSRFEDKGLSLQVAMFVTELVGILDGLLGLGLASWATKAL